MGKSGREKLIWFVQVSLVNHTLRQGKGMAKKMKEISGQKQSGSYGKWDVNGRSWKTSRGFLPLTISVKSSETWQKRGTMRNGLLYPPPQSEPLIDEDVSGFSPEYPTAAASDVRKCLSSYVSLRNPEYIPELLDGGNLNPEWIEWLMGWPSGWSESKPLAMDKFQRWRQKHSSCFDSDTRSK